MEKDNNLLAALTLDDLSGRDREMAESLGLEAFKQLVTKYGGSEPYIPKASSLVIPIRNELIRREFDGTNHVELAIKFNLTERFVRHIVEEKAKEIRRRPCDGQLDLFGREEKK